MERAVKPHHVFLGYQDDDGSRWKYANSYQIEVACKILHVNECLNISVLIP